MVEGFSANTLYTYRELSSVVGTHYVPGFTVILGALPSHYGGCLQTWKDMDFRDKGTRPWPVPAQHIERVIPHMDSPRCSQDISDFEINDMLLGYARCPLNHIDKVVFSRFVLNMPPYLSEDVIVSP